MVRPGQTDDEDADVRPVMARPEAVNGARGGGDPPEAFGRALFKPPEYEAFGRGDAQREAKREQNGSTAKEKTKTKEEDEEEGEDTRRERGGGEEKKEEEDEGEEGGDDEGEKKGKEDKEEKKGSPVYKRPVFIVTAAFVLVVLSVGAVLYWLYARQYVDTDDAYIDGHVTQISPQVAAPVKALHIEDNQLVHENDLLVELDPTDFQIALDQAMATAAAAHGRLEQARAQVPVAQAVLDEAAAEVTAAAVAPNNATRDLKRYQGVDERARTQQQLDNATAAQKTAQAKVDQARATQASAAANLKSTAATVEAAAGKLKKAEADVERARVNLGYCRIVAPSDGRVTLRTIEAGTYAQTGQAMFALVSPDIWVTANFKETQLTLMKPGQAVEISVDAYPDKKFAGHVDSIQAGSGARFSVLPAENATGNFVKVVQRVPVKIVFDHGENVDDARLLSPGLSVAPTVKNR